MRKVVKRQKAASRGASEANAEVRLTTPDLVLLSLLAERPMHGYEANATLENRKIRDWAAVSRPQVYYSLEKLTRLGLIRVTEDASSSAGPERRVFQTTEAGRKRLADALEAPRWTHTKVHPPFLTWLALSWQSRPRAFAPYHEAVWMLKLAIAQIELELNWLQQIDGETPKRAPAKRRKP
jgi:DNA-binding PadR family transcriptional regulator